MADEDKNVSHGNKLYEQPQSQKAMDAFNGGGDSATKLIEQWQHLTPNDQKTVQSYFQHLSLFERGTVQVNAGSGKDEGLNLQLKKSDPFASLPPEVANTVRKVDKGKRDEQLEAVLEGLSFIQKRKLPRGLILNNDNPMQGPISQKQEVAGCGKMADVLGKGNSAGEITVIKDKSGQDMALKTVMISQFNSNEIRLWVHLGDRQLAPELYHFELAGNKLYFTMEIMSGKDLQVVIDEDMWSFSDQSLARDFSLCILHDLLATWEEIRAKEFVHADMHAGNLRLEKSMNLKIFDFGRARNLLEMERPDANRLIKHDIVGIIRIFCALYSGYDFNNVFDAIKILEAQNLKELNEMMIRLTEDTRKELYHIMSLLFDTVRGNAPNPSFGDTTQVVSHVQSLLSSKDMVEIKKRAAVIIFPERFQNKAECEPVASPKDFIDSVPFQYECEMHTDLDPIWDDPDMEEFIGNVSDSSLEELDAF